MPPEVEARDLARSGFRIGEWLVQPSLNRVTRGDQVIQLELKVMDVLVCLAGRAGEVVSRRELTDTVWATEFISDNTVSHAVADLRTALGDDARQPTYIETIQRRGYRLIAPVVAFDADEATASKVARFPSPAGPAPAFDERSPYPGLSAFTEEDAEFFFGREAEVARMWRKLTSRRLLAVIGPSGVGKSSFLRAGVVPARPEGWGAIVCQPGEGPFGSLARALVPEFAGDVEATAQLVDLRDGDRAVAVVSRWRGRYTQALLVVDQFEELFTQNAAEEQRRFAGLLRKLVDDADVHVVVAMRDDFLYRCQGLEPLHPVFDGLLPLEQPDSESLCRALVEPARRQGYAFEDDQLPREMVAEVAGERGALPLLAFTVSRLWEKRDRGRRLLTRQAYAEVGKVGGALAKHAEATVTAIGEERLPLVRELFRNLVTAEGTRAVRETDELLSVFPEAQRDIASQVLRRLIDARLLTCFEEEPVDGKARRHRVEVVHEALLTSWPRLVRWQTQDADAAQLRDQLRQAARTWDEHGRTDDMLWTGSAYREFSLWRETYPGGLSELEEAFASAMTSLATRRRRRRRMAATVAVVLVLLVFGVFVALWRRSAQEARRAESEASRAEAQMLLALGQLDLDGYPTAALAYATSSLEVFDTPQARRLALEALWSGPSAFVVRPENTTGDLISVAFSPEGHWLASAEAARNVYVWGDRGGNPIVLEHGSADSSRGAEFAADGRILVTGTGSEVRLWSVDEFRQIRKMEFPPGSTVWGVVRDRLYTITETRPGWWARSWPLDGGDPLDFGLWDGGEIASGNIDPTGAYFAFSRALDGRLHLKRFDAWTTATDGRLIGRHPEEIGLILPLGTSGRIASCNHSGEIRIWSVSGSHRNAMRVLQTVDSERVSVFGRSGSLMVTTSLAEGAAFIHDLAGPPDAEPLEVRRGKVSGSDATVLHPDGRWLAWANLDSLSFWSISVPRPYVIRTRSASVTTLAFTGDGRWLAAGSNQKGLRAVGLWPLSAETAAGFLPLVENTGPVFSLASDSAGNVILMSTQVPGPGLVYLVPLEGDRSKLESLWPPNTALVGPVTFSPDARLVAAGACYANTDDNMVIRVWDTESGLEQVLELRGESANDNLGALEGGVVSLQFTADGRLFSAGFGGVRRWDLRRGTGDWIVRSEPQALMVMDVSRDGRFLLTLGKSNLNALEGTGLTLWDLEAGTSTPITSHGAQITDIALGSEGTFIVTGDSQGVIRIGPANGGNRTSCLVMRVL